MAHGTILPNFQGMAPTFYLPRHSGNWRLTCCLSKCPKVTHVYVQVTNPSFSKKQESGDVTEQQSRIWETTVHFPFPSDSQCWFLLAMPRLFPNLYQLVIIVTVARSCSNLNHNVFQAVRVLKHAETLLRILRSALALQNAFVVMVTFQLSQHRKSTEGTHITSF